MKLPKKPEYFAGIKVDGAMERYLKKLEEEEKAKSKDEIKPDSSPAIINPQEYLQIPNSNFLIAEFEPDWTKGFDYETSHKKVLEKGLQVPTPKTFTQHLSNVINAYQGKSELYDSQGAKVQGKRLEDIYKHLTTNHINNGALSWLNSKFLSGNDFNNLDLETVTGLDSNGNLLTKKTYLEECLMEDCYADITFNSQGLAVKKYKNQNYKQGENLYFWHPRENYVAGLWAVSGGTVLGCGRYPSYSFASLGVFASFQRS